MLTTRLNCIIDYVNSTVSADIGTDHGYVATELIKRGKAKKVIASDIRQGPLDAAIENIRKNKMEDVIEARLGSGLSVLNKNEVDTVIIAGMGGELICQIIGDDIDIARETKLILQPMNSQYELRKFLIENRFIIKSEDIECEGERVYNILIVEKGEMEPFKKDIYYHVPEYLKDNEKFNMLFNKKKREFEKIIRGLENSNNCDYNKLIYYKESLKELEAMKK